MIRTKKINVRGKVCMRKVDFSILLVQHQIGPMSFMSVAVSGSATDEETWNVQRGDATMIGQCSNDAVPAEARRMIGRAFFDRSMDELGQNLRHNVLRRIDRMGLELSTWKEGL